VVLADDVCCPVDMLTKRNGSVKTEGRKVGQSKGRRGGYHNAIIEAGVERLDIRCDSKRWTLVPHTKSEA